MTGRVVRLHVEHAHGRVHADHYRAGATARTNVLSDLWHLRRRRDRAGRLEPRLGDAGRWERPDRIGLSAGETVTCTFHTHVRPAIHHQGPQAGCRRTRTTTRKPGPSSSACHGTVLSGTQARTSRTALPTNGVFETDNSTRRRPPRSLERRSTRRQRPTTTRRAVGGHDQQLGDCGDRPPQTP